MSAQLTESQAGRVLEVRVSDKLTHADYEKFVPEFERLIKEHGKIRVLFEMADFHGWEAGALWDDIKLDMGHFSHIEKIAMVGEKRWEQWMAMVCKPFTTASIRYFERGELEQARAWVTA
jgi:SpoIIAA-like